MFTETGVVAQDCQHLPMVYLRLLYLDCDAFVRAFVPLTSLPLGTNQSSDPMCTWLALLVVSYNLASPQSAMREAKHTPAWHAGSQIWLGAMV